MENLDRQAKIDFWANKVVSPLIILILGITALFMLRSMLQNFFASSQGPTWEAPSIPLLDELDEMIDVDPLPQLEVRVDPELEKMKSELTETILADPAEATRLLITYIKD